MKKADHHQLRWGLNPVLQEIRVMGILAHVALSHPPDCDCEAVCRRLKELHQRRKEAADA